VWKKGKWFIANCPELDFVSQGRTVEEAKKNIREVVGIQFEEMKEAVTLHDYLAECGFIAEDNQFFTMNEMVSLERQDLQVV
jgi:predicted RNase H-like HicB family nuclease